MYKGDSSVQGRLLFAEGKAILIASSRGVNFGFRCH